MELVNRIAITIIKVYIEEVIGEEQAASMNDGSTTDHICFEREVNIGSLTRASIRYSLVLVNLMISLSDRRCGPFKARVQHTTKNHKPS